MVHIDVKKVFRLPIVGDPSNHEVSLEYEKVKAGDFCGVDFSSHDDIRIRPLVKPGDQVTAGQPVAKDNHVDKRLFIAPCSGIVSEVRRGEKRKLLGIVIKADGEERYHTADCGEDDVVELLSQGGIFPSIRKRPCNDLAHPEVLPEAIFINALATAPFAVPASYHVAGFEDAFSKGLELLRRLTEGKLHLVVGEKEKCKTFLQAEGVEVHTITECYTGGNLSVHMAKLHRIRNRKQVVWSLKAQDVVQLGYFALRKKPLLTKVISVAGEGIDKKRRGYYLVPRGLILDSMFSEEEMSQHVRVVSGDVLMGREVHFHDIIGELDYALAFIPVTKKRRFLHFFRLFAGSYTSFRTYVNPIRRRRGYSFSTLQHGEERAFVASQVYDKVNPLWVPTVDLVKALLAEDYEKAEELGFLEVAPEDFALQTFICPSKINMTEIVKAAQRKYVKLYIAN